MTGSLTLAPAARIVAGLQSESLSSRMQSALKDVDDVTSWTTRRLAYAAAGIDWRPWDGDAFAAADHDAMLAEISSRSGVEA